MFQCWYVFTEFRGQHFALPDHRSLDTLDDPRPDPNDDGDFNFPDQQELMDAMSWLAKESTTDFHSLLQLLADLPYLSLSQEEVEAMSVSVRQGATNGTKRSSSMHIKASQLCLH